MSKLPDSVRRSLSQSEFDWRTAEGVAKDAGLSLPAVVTALEASPEVRRAANPNSHGKALYQLKPKETLVTRILGALANAPA